MQGVKAALIGIGALSGALFGCKPDNSAHDPHHGPVRIVSLSPAISTTLLKLDQGAAIVGCTPWCRALPGHPSVVWDGATVDAERMVALQPTHVFFQATSGEASGSQLELIGAGRGWTTRSWRLDRLSDVRTMISELGETLGAGAATKAAALVERLDRACVPDPLVTKLGPVVILFGTEPPTAFGPGSYVDDLWSAIGGSNSIARGAYPELSLEELARIDPAWIVVIGSVAQLDAARRLPVSAAQNGRLILAADPGLLEPGAGVVDAVESLRAAVANALEHQGQRQ